MGCGCFGKMIGFFLGLSFAIIMPFSVWTFNIQQISAQTDKIIASFEEHNVYENLTPMILPALAEGPPQGNTNPHTSLPNQDTQIQSQASTIDPNTGLDFREVVANLKQEDWEAIANDIIPADYLQEQVETNMQSYVDYAYGKRTFLEVEFNTGVLRDNLLGQPGDSMVNRILSSWASCTPNENDQVEAYLNEETANFPYCKPTDPELQRRVFTLLNTTKDELAADIPETWNVRERYAESNNTTLQGADEFYYDIIQRPVVLFNELSPLLVLQPMALLALIMVFAVDSAKGFFSWMGWPLILTGIAVLLPLGMVPLLLSADFTPQGGGNADIETIQAETLRGLTLSFISEFTRPILMQGSVIMGIGFILVFLSILWQEDTSKESFHSASYSVHTHQPQVIPISGSTATPNNVSQPTVTDPLPPPTAPRTASSVASPAPPTPPPTKRVQVAVHVEEDDSPITERIETIFILDDEKTTKDESTTQNDDDDKWSAIARLSGDPQPDDSK